jgi:hypothetical protein
MTLPLRTIAVLIAVAGLIDPALTTAGHTRARVAVIVQDTPTLELPATGESTRRGVAERVRSRLAGAFGGDYDIQPRVTSDTSAAIVIGDSYPRSGSDSRSDLSVATVTVTGEAAPNVRILRVDAPREVPAGTGVRVGIDAEGAGVASRTSTLTVRSGGLEVGRASHQWRGGRDLWHADIDAVPIGEPPFVLRVEAQPLDVERTSIDNAVDAVVDVRRVPLRVQVYEPRPSWATTFIRRALEADSRFKIAGLSSTSKSIATRTGDAVGLSDARLDDFDVVIAGGLDRLTETNARALDRFMRARGGAVVLVPDAKPGAGPTGALLRGLTLVERLSEQPQKLAVAAPLAPIQASEMLLVRADAPLVDRLAWTSGADSSPVVVSIPRGGGRLVVSGALDAWRFRTDDAGAFDRFWQSTIAGLALAVPPPVDVSVEPPIVRPGERGDVVVRVRSVGPAVRATIDGHPIRLWPDTPAGVFRGSFVARESDGRSTVTVRVDGASQSASRPIVVRADARRELPQTTAPLSLLSASHRGIDATPDNVGDVERFIRRTVAAPVAPISRRPMRSPWWMIPFAACLSGEWYLRRRRGAR